MKLNLLFRKLTVFQSAALIVLMLLLTTTEGFSQCSFPTTETKVAGDDTFCIDNKNTITIASVKAGQFVEVNVVQGFRYTFSVGNVFSNDNETLTIFNNANIFQTGGTATGAGGASITNWSPTLSGKIKVLLSKGDCINDGTSGGVLTLTLNSVGNTQDSQDDFGTDKWVAHVYNLSTSQIPPGGTSPATPTAAYPFLTANYVGNYNIASDKIDQDFGGFEVCLPVTSAATKIYTETFAVRYRMQSTKTGYYFLDVTGDDGVRVYVDDVLVFNEWKQQGPTNYCNILVYLTGASKIVVDYYDSAGQNVVKFNLTPFNESSNLIAGLNSINVCSGSSPGTLVASAYVSCSPQTISNVVYQWQVSSDNNTWADVASAGNAKDYVVPTIITGTNNIRYFRRNLKQTAGNSMQPLSSSNVIRVNTSAANILGTTGAITGSLSQCASATGLVYRVDAVTNALNYAWTVPSGWNITAGHGTTSITVTTGAAGQNGNISVTASNGCTISAAKTLAVTVATPSITTQPTVAGVCVSGSIQSTTLSYSAVSGTPTTYSIVWDAAPANSFASVTDVNLPTGATGNIAISVPASTLAGTYTGTITVKNAAGCVSNGTKFTVTVNNNITIQVGENPYRFCVDNPNTIPTVVVNSGQYVVLDVIKGFNYTFAVGNAFSGNEILTLINDADTNNTAIVTNSGAAGTSISWTSALSGRIKIKLSTDNCTTGSTGLALTLTLNSLGNTQDLQTAFGTNSWVGHVYNWTGATPPADAFNAANYVGYFKNPTENINEGFGGNTACFPVLSNEVNRVNIYTETFAVRYRMRSSKSGYYFLNVTGDDGVRIFVDGALVFNEWKDQAPTSYCNTLIYLSGNSDIIVEYFENSGQNELKVDLTPFGNGISLNTVDGPAVRNVCTGVSGGTLTGNDLLTGCGTATLPRVSYQWQVSTNGTTFTDIAAATSKDYLVPAQTPTTNISRYYRRLVKQTATSPTQPGFPSNVIQVNTNVNTYVSNNPTLCISMPVAANTILATTSGATGIGAASGLPAGVTVTWAADKITIAGTPTASGTFNYSIPLTGGCGAVNATGRIIVTAANTLTLTSAIGSNNQTFCASTALSSIQYSTSGVMGATVTGLPAGVTGSWNSNVFTISGTPSVTGSFTYTVSLTGGCGNATATGTITIGAGIPISYTAAGWSSGGTPDINNQAIFDSSYSTVEGEHLTACNCQVNSGAILTILKNSSVTIQNNIINNGNIVVESDGNMIQNNDFGTYTGTATSFLVKREANLKRLDYNYWASPVKDQQLKTFSPGTVATRFLTYDEKDDFFYAITSTYNFGAKIDGTLESEAKGYAIRANNAYPPATPATPAPLQVFKGEFKGVPNNGVITFPLKKTRNGYNLVGNPYSSNIDFETLYSNNSTNINYVAYFWTNVNLNPAMQGEDYPKTGSTNNYAVLNGTGGVPATGTAAPGGGKTPNRYIKVGQGFIVKAINPVNLQFKNTLRKANASSVFFNKNEFSVDRFWLKLTTPLEVVTTQLIGYLSQATNGFELDYDAPLMVLGSDAFYSLLGDQKLAIQGKAPFINSDAVSLGSSQYKTGNYTISLGDKEGIFANGQNIYLKDKQSGTVTNISETDYTFTANEGLTEGRFEIVYLPGAVLSTDSNSKEGLIIYRAGNEFVVKSTTKNITGLEVYDTSGRLVQKLKPNHKETRIDASNLINGIYIFKINQEGMITSKKVMK